MSPLQITLGICDDESHVHKFISQFVELYEQKYACTIQLVHFYSAQELLNSQINLNILLLDIDMPEVDGIEAASQLRHNQKHYTIIMLSAKRERFKDAFKIGAYRFVTKPIDILELEEAINDAEKTLLGYSSITLKFDNVPCKISQYKIDYLEACGDYVIIIIGENIYESNNSLKSWKAILDERLFIDCHKSYIVNMKSIVTIDKDILLKNGTRIPISRRKKNDVLQAYIKFDTHYNRI